jgi:ABC-type multidrug transport system fused ATPase/permease subunit
MNNLNLDFLENAIYLIDDSFIEKLLTKALINDNSHENDKQIIQILIENDKKLHFRLFRYTFLLTFLIELAYIVDNAEDKVLLKIFSTASIIAIRPTLAKKCRIYEKEAMSLLEKSILTKFNKNVENIIYKDIEEYNYNDNIIKNIYLDAFHNILSIFEKYRSTIGSLSSFLVNILILVFFYPLLFKLKYGFIQNIFNIGFVIVYQIVVVSIFQRFTTKNKNNKNTEENELKNMIYSLFQNINIIIESDSLKDELNKITKHVEKMVSNENILNKYAYIKTTPDYVKSMKYYKILETLTSIIVNDSYLLFFTDTLKSKIVYFVEVKKELYKRLNFGHNIVDVLNVKDYQISKTIAWSNEMNHPYLFVLEDVSISYKNKYGTTTKILDSINLNFELGKSHFLYGNSGCGKTTLLNALIKKVKIESGSIKFLNTYDTYTYFSIRNYLTYLTSESALFSKSVYYNIVYGIDDKTLTENNEEIMEVINKYITLFGLEKYLPTLKKTNATILSKGETQRVAIIRLIIGIMFNDTRILLLDEFTSNIDNVMEENIYTEIRKLQETYHFTMFYVSHNLYNMKYSDFKYEIDTNNHSIRKIETSV